jgi:hypothetical protein
MECNGEKVLNLKHLVTLIEDGEKVRVETKYELIMHVQALLLYQMSLAMRSRSPVYVSVCLE